MWCQMSYTLKVHLILVQHLNKPQYLIPKAAESIYHFP